MKAIKIAMLIVVVWCGAKAAFAQTWTQTSAPSNRWWSVASSADGIKLVVASSLNIYTSTNSGTTWVLNNVPGQQWWKSVASSADGRKLVIVAWKGGPIYTSANSGLTWMPTSAPNNYWCSVASSADGVKLVAAGTDAGDQRIYTSTNSGATWTAIALSNYWYAVASSADGSKLAATTAGSLYFSTNSGVTWLQSVTSANNSWVPGNSIAMSADGSKVVAIAGGGGNVYISTNSGSIWSSKSLPFNGSWSSVTSSADGAKLIAVAQSGVIYTSTNFGASWVLNNGPSLQWQSVASSADGNKLVALSADNFSGQIWTAQSALLPSALLPSLNIAPLNHNALLSWILPSTNFEMQQSSDLQNWVDMTNAPVLNLTNLQDEVILPPPGSNVFYRLKTP